MTLSTPTTVSGDVAGYEACCSALRPIAHLVMRELDIHHVAICFVHHDEKLNTQREGCFEDLPHYSLSALNMQFRMLWPEEAVDDEPGEFCRRASALLDFSIYCWLMQQLNERTQKTTVPFRTIVDATVEFLQREKPDIYHYMLPLLPYLDGTVAHPRCAFAGEDEKYTILPLVSALPSELH